MLTGWSKAGVSISFFIFCSLFLLWSKSGTAGSLDVEILSAAAGGGAISTRIFYPAYDQRRYREGAPVVVISPGGHNPGSIPPDDPDAASFGYISIYFLMPGGSAEGLESDGRYDYRGMNSQRALADVLLFAAGEKTDAQGKFLTDYIPFTLTNNVGVVGYSNGGNLAIATLAHYGDELGNLQWLVTWESPIGDQTVTVELSMRLGNRLNPYYQPGTSTVTGCPWPGLDAALQFDATAPFFLEDPATETRFPLAGIFYLDTNGDGSYDQGDFSFSPLGGPGVMVAGTLKPKGYFSAELMEAITSQAGRLFATTPPPWLATLPETLTYWQDRDGSLLINTAHQKMPGLRVISVSSVRDHVQSQPDHPHVRSNVAGWIDSGHGFIRHNPDAVYVTALCNCTDPLIPDNDAGTAVPYPGIDQTLEPEHAGGRSLDEFVSLAAILELCDRTYTTDSSANLDTVLVQPWKSILDILFLPALLGGSHSHGKVSTP